MPGILLQSQMISHNGKLLGNGSGGNLLPQGPGNKVRGVVSPSQVAICYP